MALSDDDIVRIMTSIPEPASDSDNDVAVWVTNLCIAIEAETRKQSEALRIADDLRHSITNYGAEDAFTFAAYEAEQCVRALHAEIETLRAGYSAARLEIESLRERVQQLGQLARDVNSRRVVELEAQLEAVGAGGVGPLLYAATDARDHLGPSSSAEVVG